MLNERGWERLRAAGLDRVDVTFAATEGFNRANGNASLEEAVGAAEAILARAPTRPGDRHDLGRVRLPVRGRGRSGPRRRPRGALAGRGRDRARRHDRRRDAVGRARARRAVETGAVGFHGHNTRNTGFANAYAALEAGASLLDASVGGLGGCPFAPRATGNIATEDLVYLLEGEGVETGVDLDALVATSAWLESVLGRRLEGYVYRAGPFPPGA